MHRGSLTADETARIGATTVTTPTRTAFDLARWACSLTERVAAVDALAHCCAVDLEAVRVLRNRHLGVRQGSAVTQVLALANPGAESPMESRCRMALNLGGRP